MSKLKTSAHDSQPFRVITTSCKKMPRDDRFIVFMKKRVFRWNFERKIPFNPFISSHGLSVIFPRDAYLLRDERLLVMKWEDENPEANISSVSVEEILSQERFQEVSVYLVSHTAEKLLTAYKGSDPSWTRRIRWLSLSDSVNWLCHQCFGICRSISSVTFSACPRMTYLPLRAFWSSGLMEVRIPDTVESIGESCFSSCKNLARVTFGESSSLKLIGRAVFIDGGLVEINIPRTVESMREYCFQHTKPLARITFEEPAALKVIACGTFDGVSELREIHIPDSVEDLCDMCFSDTRNLSRVRFGVLSSLKRIGMSAFARSFLAELRIPDSVEELCDRCCCSCTNLSRVFVSDSSSLKKIG